MGASFFPFFTIDSVDRLITLVVSAEQNIYDNIIGTAPVGYAELELNFDSIHFQFAGDSIIVIPGKYPCSYSFSAMCSFGIDNPCYGTCSEYGSITDSLFLEIDPVSSVVLATPTLPTSLMVRSDGDPVVFSFASAQGDRELEISNQLGVLVGRTIISPMQASMEIALRPGCYFARLSDEVAKFIVPPR